MSFQIKARKPALEGFMNILQHFNLNPEEAVFTDDSTKNLVNAKKLGIYVVHFKDAQQLADELKSWLMD